jgi:antibiotic biosynthesis monooxygenase (ABM) superfamily enzyme
MILEIAQLQIRPGQRAAFEAAFANAQKIIASMPGYLGHELQHCLENEHRYALLVPIRRISELACLAAPFLRSLSDRRALRAGRIEA